MRCECRCREIVQAIVQDAYRCGGKNLRRFNKSSAIDIERAQVRRCFVENQLQALAVEIGVALLCKNQTALAFAVSYQQFYFHQAFAACLARSRVVFLGKVVQQLFDASRFA